MTTHKVKSVGNWFQRLSDVIDVIDRAEEGDTIIVDSDQMVSSAKKFAILCGGKSLAYLVEKDEEKA